jgi:hypothetical protein
MNSRDSHLYLRLSAVGEVSFAKISATNLPRRIDAYFKNAVRLKLKYISSIMFVTFALTATTASADDLCSIMSDVNSALKTETAASKQDSFGKSKGYLLSRLQQFKGISACKEGDFYVELHCSVSVEGLGNYLAKRSPRFDEVDSLLRKCYSRTQNDTSSPWYSSVTSRFLNTYSWGNDRYVLLLKQSDSEGGLGTFVDLEIWANPKQLISASANTSTSSKLTSAEGNWLVIAGSWPPSQQAKVAARLALLSKNDIAADRIKTDDFPGLTPGLVAVVLGPMSKDAALAQLQTVQSVVPDAFIKESP